MKHFKIQELVDKATFENLGVRSVLMLNPILLNAIDELRTIIDSPVVVNTWVSGGHLQYRGFRPSYSDVGAPYSQHRLGNAVDFHCPRIEITALHRWVMHHQSELYDLGFRAVEDFTFTTSWVHLDIRPIESDTKKLKIITP